MRDELDKAFQQTKLMLSDAERYYRCVYDSALDIGDFAEAQRVSAVAQRNILQIRKWKSNLDTIYTEIVSSSILTIATPSETQITCLTELNGADDADLVETIAPLEIQATTLADDVAESSSVTCLQAQVLNIEERQVDVSSSESFDANEHITESFHAYGSPTIVRLLGKTFSVTRWSEVYIKVCERMLLHKPYIIAGLANDAELHDNQVMFSYIESKIDGNRKRLSNGLWFRIGESADDCVRLSHSILEKCGYAPEALVVDLKED